MAKHGAGVAQAKISILMIISAGEGGAFGLVDKERKRQAPIHHPVHGNAPQPVF